MLDASTAFNAGVLFQHYLISEAILSALARDEGPRLASDVLLKFLEMTEAESLPEASDRVREEWRLFHSARQESVRLLRDLAKTYPAEREHLPVVVLQTCGILITQISGQLGLPNLYAERAGWGGDDLVSAEVAEVDGRLVLSFDVEPLPARTH